MKDVWKTIKTLAPTAGVNEATVRTWVSRGYVPASRHHELVEISKNTQTPITYEQLNALR